MMRFINKRRFVAAAAVLFLTPLGMGWGETIDVLRSVPLEVSGYPQAQQFPTHFQTADEVLRALDSTPVLLVHMEAFRRSYADLSVAERNKVLAALQKRHKLAENDLQIGFDYGYAQLIYTRNKTGLFFLRKANDRFQSQFSSLAYGMAELEADVLLENAAPEQMTTRKLDVIYQLGDAVKRDAQSHQPGFWPSFVRVLEKMKPMPAYGSFPRRDFSLVYVPYGSRVVPLKTGAVSQALPLQNVSSATLLSNSLNTACNPGAVPEDGAVTSSTTDKPRVSAPVSQKSASFNGRNALIQFFPTEEPNQLRVRVLDQTGQPLLSFTSHAAPPSIVEDLDGDGTLEIVARQYAYNPLEPVRVYRYTPCGFELDRKIFEYFR